MSREPQSPDWTQEPRAPPPPDLTQQPWVPPLLERTQQPPTPPTPERTQRIQRFLVLTTQHSGSSWLTDQLNAQPGVTCLRELLEDLDYNRLPRNDSHVLAPSWTEWQARAEAAFQRTHAAHSKSAGERPVAIGFKLMYSQIWDSRSHLTKGTKPDSWGRNARFVAWLRAHNIRVLHLVRGATLLRDNDLHEEKRDAARLAAAGAAVGRRRAESVQSLEELSLLQAVFRPMRYSAKELTRAVATMEAPVLYWRELLAATSTDHHVLLYESLLGASRGPSFASAVAYVGGPRDARLFDAREAVANGSKVNLRVHPMTCEERIESWGELKFLLPGDGLTFMSCELLASLARDGSLWT